MHGNFTTSDGQKIAKKLSQQILRETKVIKQLIQDYNSCCKGSSNELTLSEALDPLGVATQLELAGLAKPGCLSCGKKRPLIDAYLMLSRSKEELAMLDEDIKNINYYKERDTAIRKEMDSCNSCSGGFDLQIKLAVKKHFYTKFYRKILLYFRGVNKY